VGHPLVICAVSSRSPQGAERCEREKLCHLPIDSIVKVTYWSRFLFNAYEESHKSQGWLQRCSELQALYLSRQFRGYVSLSRKAKDGYTQLATIKVLRWVWLQG